MCLYRLNLAPHVDVLMEHSLCLDPSHPDLWLQFKIPLNVSESSTFSLFQVNVEMWGSDWDINGTVLKWRRVSNCGATLWTHEVKACMRHMNSFSSYKENSITVWVTCFHLSGFFVCCVCFMMPADVHRNIYVHAERHSVSTHIRTNSSFMGFSYVQVWKSFSFHIQTLDFCSFQALGLQ